MTEPIFSRDVHPITDFKAKGSAIVEQARQTGRPVLITQRGRGVAVVVSLDEFERMRDELARRGQFASSAEVAAVLGKQRR